MSDDLILHLEKLRVETVTGAVLVDDVDVTLKRGEILGLIGESGAGKSTIGLASMAYARAGCKITGGSITIDGTELRASTAAQRRNIRGKSIAYIAQSAAASFNPAMTLMEQVCEAPVTHGVMSRQEAEAYALRLFKTLQLPNRRHRARRADHGARRDHADRGAGAPARPHPRVRHGGPLHHPRPRRGGADRAPHHGAAPRQDGRGRPGPADSRGADDALRPRPGERAARGRAYRADP